MQRPRHRNLAAAFLTRHALGRLFACLLLFSLVAATGCRDDSAKENARQAAEYRASLDASGKRVVIVDADGNRLGKLRKRRDQIKVYDDDLKALGYVRWDRPKPEIAAKPAPDDEASAEDSPLEDDVADSKSDEGSPKESLISVQIKMLGSNESVHIVPVEGPADSPRIFELAGRFRIVEQPPSRNSESQSSWRVIGPDKKVIGIFKKSGKSEWQLLTDAIDGSAAADATDFNADYRVKEVDAPRRMKVIRDKKVVAKIQFGELSPLELLSLQLEKLPPLERISVGVWLTNNSP